MKKKIIIPIAAVLVVGALVGFAIYSSSKPQLPIVKTTPIASTDLINAVSVTGMVKSEDAVNVYSTLSYPVKLVNVEVGDTVSEGDVLCELDTATLEATIAQQKASLSTAQQKAQHNINVSKKDLETASFNAEKDYNTALLKAQSDVKTADIAQRNAVIDVNNARSDLKDLRDDKKQVDDDTLYEDAIDAAQRLVITRELALEKANQAVEDAKAALRAVEMAHKEELITRSDAVTTAELNANFSDTQIGIQKLETDLADAIIKAPVSGTVTAVFVKEGASPTGILVVIEDTSKLMITTKVKEYDIANVRPGADVTIKSDGTGEEVYDGAVSKIAPTSLKTATGAQVDTTDVEFETDIKVLTQPNNLRIGMNARLNIIIEEKKGVFALPYDALVTREDGTNAVFIARTQEDGSVTAEEVPVETGLETDFNVEIISSAISEGDLIITDTEGLKSGDAVTLESADEGDPATVGGPGGPRMRMG